MSEEYMQQALDAARQAKYSCRPNPAVGCVIVKDKKVIAVARHEKYGKEHAEVLALKQAGDNAKGATVYVTLEPCSHVGKTNPCADALIKSKVGKVFVACEDVNPLVAGQGIQKLKENNISVELGLLKEKAYSLNKEFFKRVSRNRPYIRLKVASSIDGKTSMLSGESKWITSSVSREDVQMLRAKSCAILTGVNTVIADNPSLNVRSDEAKKIFLNEKVNQPLVYVVDSNGRLLELLKTRNFSLFKKNESKIVLIVGKQFLENFKEKCTDDDFEEFLPSNLEVKTCNLNNDGKIDLLKLQDIFIKDEINSLLVEAGPTLTGSFLKENLFDEAIFYLAPKVLGSKANSLASIDNILTINDSLNFKFSSVEKIGDDLKIVAECTV